MKKYIILIAVFMALIFAFMPVYAEEAVSEEIPSEVTAEAESKEEFGELMTELYEYWKGYTETEGDNSFEKAVNFAWRYRGDIGGVAAAVAVAVLLIVITFRFIPLVKRYAGYVCAGNDKTKEEISETVKTELGKYAPALATVTQVSELYPAFKELIEGLVKENAELKEIVMGIGARIEETERRHAAAMVLQGKTFKDIITLAALPAAKKEEILSEYKRIEEGVTEGE